LTLVPAGTDASTLSNDGSPPMGAASTIPFGSIAHFGDTKIVSMNRSMLQRSLKMRVRFNDFLFDGDRRQLLRAGESVHLPPKIFRLLQILVEARPQAISQEELYDRLWPDTVVEKSNLHNLVYQLREALEDREQTIIRTVHGFGFSFAATVGPDVPRSVWQIVIGDREFDLFEGENLVGRERGVSVRIDSGSISRHHARITVSPTGVTLEDLGSKNGTSLRGRRVHAITELQDGDRIVFGTVAAVLRAVRPAGSTETAG
jgi:DNA-binding winged helix-turn-helix (wHTH) protein